MLPRFIPPATREKLANPAPVGERHKQLLDIVIALTARGWPPDEIFKLVRPNYPSDGPHPVQDGEIWDIIDGAQRYDLSASPPLSSHLHRASEPPPTRYDPAEVVTRVRRFVGDVQFAEADFVARSPIKLLDPRFPQRGGAYLLAKLFERDEFVNLVWGCKRNPDGKAVPFGYGQTVTCRGWIHRVFDSVPTGDGGTWIRINPLDGQGINDRNVVAWRYALLESDVIGLDLQLALLAKLKLPIAAVVTSGGKSIHGWAKVDAPNAETYAKIVAKLLSTLAAFGIDPANKNPSRLARFPGGVRKIGAVGDGIQRLLFLNPNPESDQVIADLPIRT